VLLFNAHDEDRTFVLPRQRMGRRWGLELSTADPEAQPGSAEYVARAEVHVVARSVVVLKRLA
jgi:isoamylase